MTDTRTEMEYTGADGKAAKIRESTVIRLRHVAKYQTVGRFLNPPKPLYKRHEVEALANAGLWTVDWVEPGDDDHQGAWVITGLTDHGRELLERWERVVERGERKRGPARRNTTTRA